VERKQVDLGTLLLIPLAFLVKDIIATMALLSREPGITERAAYYFALASLPATLFVTTAYAMAVNLLIGALTSVIVYVVIKLQTRRHYGFD
jgi:hypothetical protein